MIFDKTEIEKKSIQCLPFTIQIVMSSPFPPSPLNGKINAW